MFDFSEVILRLLDFLGGVFDFSEVILRLLDLFAGC